jgi:zinc transport system substrate-binding protein
MKKALRLILFLSMLFFIGTAVYVFAQSRTAQNTNKLQVTASFYPMAYFAEEVGGDKASVRNITPSGAEPHDFEPTAQDITTIQNSKILVLNGIGFEPWFSRIENDVKQNNVQVVVASEGISVLAGEDPHSEEEHAADEHAGEDHAAEAQDPHVWLSPVLAQQQVANILKGYIAADPANEAYYRSNAEALTKRLAELDTKYRNGLQQCESEDIITSHTAFAYLANEYMLHQVAISGLSSEDPSTQQLTEVANFARENNVQYIFFESLVSPRLSETIANEVGAQTLVLDPLEGIPDDERAQGKNYFTVMEANLNNLQTALGCRK